MTNTSTIDPVEIARFSALADHWWESQGPLKTLHAINPPRLEFIEGFVNLSGKRVLDAGCGGGILSESMARKGALVTGIDAGVEAVEVARAHAGSSALEIDYVHTPIEEFEAQPFDAITCMEMLEHVPEPELVLRHCHRLLKPGGYLFLSTINRNLLSYGAAILAAEYVLKLLPRQTHDYNKFIKPAELAAAMRAAGLELAGLEGMHYNPLSGLACLQDSVAVNYLMCGYKS